jgi:TfoX/Sxy family transcriptional regulator of competence genes
MVYNESLASRIREIFAGGDDVTEKKMFGGIAFMVKGHMAAGIVGDDLMLRIGEEGYEAALKRPHVRPMDFTGRPMRGMIYVVAAGIKTREALSSWLDKATANARSLPPKQAKKSRPPRAKKPSARPAK